jgi:ribonuclease-3
LTKRLPIEKALGVRFGSQELYTWAFTHRSYAYENGGLPTNERLEFLGDAVLGLVVTDIIYRAFPNLPEGQLAKLRAATVNMNVLADVARGLGVGAAVQLGRGEELSGGRDKSSILADTLEAILGAVYLDKGLPRAAALVRRLFQERVMEAAGRGAALDYKTSLQELAASSLGGMPSYSIEEEGPDHAKRFTATVSVAGVAYGTGKGRSKKEAEQNAAQEAFETLAASRMVTGTAEGDQADVVEAGPLPAPGPPVAASPGRDGPAAAGPDAAQANGQRGGRAKRRRTRAAEPRAGAAAGAVPDALDSDEPPSA